MMHQYQSLMNGQYPQVYVPRPAYPILNPSPSTEYAASLQSSIRQQDLQISDIRSEMQSLTFEQDEAYEMMLQQRRTTRKLEDQMRRAVDIITKQENDILTLQNKIHHLNTKHMKSEIRISGLEKGNFSTWREAANDFFVTKLKISSNIQIDSAFPKGDGERAPIIVKLSKKGDKKVIFEHVKNLKGVKNSSDRSYGVSSNLPDREYEADLKKRQIVCDNKELPLSNRKKIHLEKGTLFVDKCEFKNPLCRPTAEALFALSPEELNKCETVDVSSCQVLSMKNSHFHGFAMQVSNLEDVQRMYLHFAIKFANATHIMAAYLLPGYNKAYDQGYTDDNEHGGGRRLLRLLTGGDHFSTMVIVVRYYGQIQLGTDRFDLITRAATGALDNMRQLQVKLSQLIIKQKTEAPQTVRRRLRTNRLPFSTAGAPTGPRAARPTSTQQQFSPRAVPTANSAMQNYTRNALDFTDDDSPFFSPGSRIPSDRTVSDSDSTVPDEEQVSRTDVN